LSERITTNNYNDSTLAVVETVADPRFDLRAVGGVDFVNRGGGGKKS